MSRLAQGGLNPENVMVCFKETAWENWSFGNGFSTAAYFHAFKDATGAPLDGANSAGYILTFSAAEIPQAASSRKVLA